MSRRLDLTSSREKLRWAKHHIDELKAAIKGWAERHANEPVRLRRKVEPDDDGAVVTFIVAHVAELDRDWPLMIGDAVNNTRAAFDHVAWQLVQAGNKPTANPKGVYFPLSTTNRKDFLTKHAPGNLPGVSLRRLLRLSPFQPYERRERRAWSISQHRLPVVLGLWTPNPLPLIFRLTNEDKHQKLVLTVVLLKGYLVGHRSDLRVIEQERLHPPRQPLRPGTELIRARLRGSPRLADYANVSMHFQADSTIAFDDGTPVIFALERAVHLGQAMIRKLSQP